MYRAVIFDVDGTLVASNDAHARAWADALAESGLQVPVERVRPLIGMGGDKLLPRLTGIDIKSPDGEAIAKNRAKIFRERYLPFLEPTRGAQRLLETLHNERMQLLVASSATAEELGDLLRVAQAPGGSSPRPLQTTPGARSRTPTLSARLSMPRAVRRTKS